MQECRVLNAQALTYVQRVQEARLRCQVVGVKTGFGIALDHRLTCYLELVVLLALVVDVGQRIVLLLLQPGGQSVQGAFNMVFGELFMKRFVYKIGMLVTCQRSCGTYRARMRRCRAHTAASPCRLGSGGERGEGGGGGREEGGNSACSVTSIRTMQDQDFALEIWRVVIMQEVSYRIKPQ